MNQMEVIADLTDLNFFFVTSLGLCEPSRSIENFFLGALVISLIFPVYNSTLTYY